MAKFRLYSINYFIAAGVEEYCGGRDWFAFNCIILTKLTDLAVVYVHSAMQTSNEPSTAWLKETYKMMPRKSARCLKSYPLDQESSSMKSLLSTLLGGSEPVRSPDFFGAKSDNLVAWFAAAFTSKKFWAKVNYVGKFAEGEPVHELDKLFDSTLPKSWPSRLYDLFSRIPGDAIAIPNYVVAHDKFGGLDSDRRIPLASHCRSLHGTYTHIAGLFTEHTLPKMAASPTLQSPQPPPLILTTVFTAAFRSLLG